MSYGELTLLQGFVPCLLAHQWRGIIYRGASPLFINEEN